MSTEGEIRQLRFQLPPGATDVFLVRHGESAAAHPDRPFPTVDGQGDPELHEHGRAQAERLADVHLAALYVTNLQRTQQTAGPLAARLGLTPIVEADLREVFLGEWEGGTFREKVVAGHPLLEVMRREERWDIVPGAEPAEAFATRVAAGLGRIAARHPDESVAVFTHGGVIGQLLSMATGSRGFAFGGADNASISQLVVLGDRWILRRFNDTAHLDEGFTDAPEPLT